MYKRAVHSQAQSALKAQAAQAATDPNQMPMNAGGSSEPKKVDTIRNVGAKAGRCDPCPCGSGKKYENCHQKNEGK